MSYLIPDDPVVHHMEQTGLPPWNDGKEPKCPICGEGCDTFYRNSEGDVVGCEKCLTPYDAWEAIDYDV